MPNPEIHVDIVAKLIDKDVQKAARELRQDFENIGKDLDRNLGNPKVVRNLDAQIDRATALRAALKDVEELQVAAAKAAKVLPRNKQGRWIKGFTPEALALQQKLIQAGAKLSKLQRDTDRAQAATNQSVREHNQLLVDRAHLIQQNEQVFKDLTRSAVRDRIEMVRRLGVERDVINSNRSLVKGFDQVKDSASGSRIQLAKYYRMVEDGNASFEQLIAQTNNVRRAFMNEQRTAQDYTDTLDEVGRKHRELADDRRYMIQQNARYLADQLGETRRARADMAQTIYVNREVIGANLSLQRGQDRVTDAIAKTNLEHARWVDMARRGTATREQMITQSNRMQSAYTNEGRVMRDYGDELKRLGAKHSAAALEAQKAASVMGRLGRALGVGPSRSPILNYMARNLGALTPLGMVTPTLVVPLVTAFTELGKAVITASQSFWLLPAAITGAAAGMITLNLGMAGFSNVITDLMAGDFKKFNEDLFKLSDNAAQVALSFKSIMFPDSARGDNSSLWRLQRETQDALFEGIAPRLEQLFGTYYAEMTHLFTGIARSMNGVMKEVFDGLTTPVALNDVSIIIGRITLAFEQLVPLVRPLVQAFLDLTVVGSSFLPGLMKDIVGLAEGFANFIRNARESGKLKEWMQMGIDAVKALLGLIGHLGAVLYDIFGIKSKKDLDDFKQTMTEMIDLIGLGLLTIKTIGEGLARIFRSFGRPLIDFLADLPEMASAALNYIIERVNMWGKIFYDVLTAPLRLFITAFNALPDGIIGPANVIIDVFNGIGDAIAKALLKPLELFILTYNAIPDFAKKLAFLPAGDIPLPGDISPPDVPHIPPGGIPQLPEYPGIPRVPSGGDWGPFGRTGGPWSGPRVPFERPPGMPPRGPDFKERERPPSTDPNSPFYQRPPREGSDKTPPWGTDIIAPGAFPGAEWQVPQYNPPSYNPNPGVDSPGSPPPGETGPGFWDVDERAIIERQRAVEDQRQKLEESRIALIDLQRGGNFSEKELLDAKRAMNADEWDYITSQWDLTEALQGTWKKLADSTKEFSNVFDEIGSLIDKDFGVSKGLVGIADNIVRFLAALAFAPAMGALAAVRYKGDPTNAAEGAGGLIGMGAVSGAFGPNFMPQQQQQPGAYNPPAYGPQGRPGMPLAAEAANISNVPMPANLLDTGPISSGDQARYVATVVGQRWGSQLRGQIGGSRPPGPGTRPGTHDVGKSIDIPIGKDQKSMGDEMNLWLQANAAQLGIDYTIWRDKGINAQDNQSGKKGTTFGVDPGTHQEHIDVKFQGGGVPGGVGAGVGAGGLPIPLPVTIVGGAGGAGLTEMGGPPSSNLMAALKRAGIDPAMYPVIAAFAKTEGNNPSGVPTLGFTDTQVGTGLDQHTQALANQMKARQMITGPFPAGASPAEQAAWMATLVGQNGVVDWQGNQQPPRADYINRIASQMAPVGAGPMGPMAGFAQGGAVPIIAHAGEHVLTAKDVSAMGGQGGVYSFRHSLHSRSGGPDDTSPGVPSWDQYQGTDWASRVPYPNRDQRIAVSPDQWWGGPGGPSSFAGGGPIPMAPPIPPPPPVPPPPPIPSPPPMPDIPGITTGLGTGPAPGPPPTGPEALPDVGGVGAPAGSGPGIGPSGSGILGIAEQAAVTGISLGVDAIAPGAGQAAAIAAQIGMQEINRAIKAAGQYAGIAVGGLMETFLPAGGSELAANNWITRIAGGMLGAVPQLPNTAGKAPTPVPELTPEQASAQTLPPFRDQHTGTGPPPGPQVNVIYNNNNVTDTANGERGLSYLLERMYAPTPAAR